ncbi:lipoprotein [Pandoraea terrigena]|uniref:Lipoprotein n=1 Tax=Pandoraea terrigena TaxID=2508292 RepID=A0A5E4RTL1_9BURK|nr:DUF6726 family protein [Pandoraea terrigena]VVD66597.1 lipoprotein [Pandoraea terrigena]
MTLLSPMPDPAIDTSPTRPVTVDGYDSRALDVGDAPLASKPAPRNLRRWWALFAILPFVTSVSGCGLMAAPCRVASAGLKIVPGVGGVLAAPTDACAAAID